jgi:hypothetical protein
MQPRTVYDLVKSHLHLPINRDYTALKRVLREWHQYSTQVPLQKKPTFPAELLITITRVPPSAHRDGAKTLGQHDAMTAKLLGDRRRSSIGRSRRWSLWKSRATPPTSSAASTAALLTEQESKPFVYRKVVPLHVWTSVLPWEMQRGLSFSDLSLSSALTDDDASSPVRNNGRHESVQLPNSRDKETAMKDGKVEEEEEEDPYGVVTPLATAAGGPPPPPPSAAAAASFTLRFLASHPAHRPSISIAAPTPAMLFLSDTASTRAYGIGFWSGAIRQPIDVLFVAPTLPTSVGPSSPSFQQLRQQDSEAAVEDNRVSQQVLTRFFPLREMQPTSMPASSVVTFRVHSFSHLDPLPPSLHPCRVDAAEGQAAGNAFTATPDAPYNSVEEAPRYVLETPRNTLQPAVAAALRESRSIFSSQTGATEASTRAEEVDDHDVSIDLVVNFSDSLRADVFAKAQLCVEYVSLLESAITHYVRELNTDRTAATVAADPLEGGDCNGSQDVAADYATGDGGVAGVTAERPIKVWLSEHESRWMTPRELRNAAASSVNAAAAGNAAMESEEVACTVEDDATHQSTTETFRNGDEVEEAAAYPVTARSTSSSPSPPRATHTMATTAAAAAQSVGATPAQRDAVSASRSISLQSPMLQDETEGRPSYLVPSFVGRHESSTLQSSAVVLSADKLARYPKTHSHMPQLPPIDYELYDLCTRLGVGQQAILYHYHERILREWRAELQRRRHRLTSQQPSGSSDDQYAATATSAIAPADVARMVALVRDRSLQLSPELVSLVEAVAAA